MSPVAGSSIAINGCWTTQKMSSYQNLVVVCSVCGSADDLQRCARCKLIWYCGKEHQKKDWKKHKVTCIKSEILGDNNSLKNKPNDYRDSDKSGAQLEQIENNSGSSSIQKSVLKKYGHKIQNKNNSLVLPVEGSSEIEILSSVGETLSLNNNFDERSATEKALKCASAAMPISGENIIEHKHKGLKFYPEIPLYSDKDADPFQHKNQSKRMDDMCRNIIQDLSEYGLCVIDDFLGYEEGRKVLEEVLNIKQTGYLKDGQLVSTKGKAREDLKTIRGDKICWVHGKEKNCENIGYLISKVDALITRANKMPDNGKLSQYNINGRTKAMVACYPGSGAHYVKHVDNPNKDGRCITTLYYLNMNWDVNRSGGLLRIFPEGWREDKVADIVPKFDRLIFFWSDRRNPHEVQPAYDTRYAITLWYFDAAEREQALKKYGMGRLQEPTSVSSHSNR